MKTNKTKPKIVAMIPARLGSKRIKHKNLRLLDGKTLCHHVITKCQQSGIFDEIYINSESEIFHKLADECGVRFFKRSELLARDNITNDLFANDFLEHVQCDILIQVNPTSPFISVQEIKKFVNFMNEGNYDTLHSVKRERIEAIFKGKPLNFNPLKIMPKSQDLEPVFLFSSGIMGWKSQRHLENMKELGCATYGGKGKTGYFVLKGYSTVDIDEEEDFQLAEIIVATTKHPSRKVQYYRQLPEVKTNK